MKCGTAIAIELMWPGVPVSAWASILPARESKTPGRHVAALAGRHRKRGADQRLRLLLDDGQQPVPDDLEADLVGLGDHHFLSSEM